MPAKTSLGIEIGNRAFSVVYLKASFKDTRLAAHAIYPFEREKTEEDKADMVGGLVRDFLRKNRISPGAVFLGIPRDTAILKYVELPSVVKENLQESLGYELEKHVPFSPDEIYFDSQVIAEGQEQGKIRLALVVVKREVIAPYFELGKRIGVGLSGIEISSTAVTNYLSCYSDSEKGDPSLYVYLRNHKLELGLVREGLLRYSRMLPWPEESAKSRKDLSKELDLLKEVVGDYQAPLTTVLCFADSNSELIACFRDERDLDVRLVDLSRAELPTFALIPAYGLALKGLRNLPMNINFLPRSLRKKPNRIPFYAMLTLACLLILSAFAWGGSAFLRHRAELDSLDAEIKRLGTEIASINRKKTRIEQLEKQIDYLNTLRGVGAPILQIMKELSERIPESAWVSGLAFSDKGLQIDGQAASASELIPLLDASPIFGDVTFRSAITKGRDGKEKFRIGLKIIEK